MSSKCNTLVLNNSNSLFRQQGQSFGDVFAPSSSEGEKVVQLPPLRAYNYSIRVIQCDYESYKRSRLVAVISSCARSVLSYQ